MRLNAFNDIYSACFSLLFFLHPTFFCCNENRTSQKNGWTRYSVCQETQYNVCSDYRKSSKISWSWKKLCPDEVSKPFFSCAIYRDSSNTLRHGFFTTQGLTTGRYRTVTLWQTKVADQQYAIETKMPTTIRVTRAQDPRGLQISASPRISFFCWRIRRSMEAPELLRFVSNNTYSWSVAQQTFHVERKRSVEFCILGRTFPYLGGSRNTNCCISTRPVICVICSWFGSVTKEYRVRVHMRTVLSLGKTPKDLKQ